MISIECDIHNQARYEFNKPFSSIKMEWGKSTEILPKLVPKHGKSIYWLDYDDSFQPYILEDVAIISEAIESGGVLALSFNCEPLKADMLGGEHQIREQLIKMVSKEFVANNLDTRGWTSSKKLAVFLKHCISDKIGLVLKSRNYSLSEADKLEATQKLFFTYADGATMATIAYVFSSKKDKGCEEACHFSDLYFVREDDEPFDISMPNLTIKEIRHLMEIRPSEEAVNSKIFAQKDVDSLWKNYRYFPGFSEIESF